MLFSNSKIRQKYFFNGLWITKWKLNDKCHFICSTNDTVAENQVIYNSTFEKLLDVKFDYKLTFNAHIDDICKKAGLKLNALSRIAPSWTSTKNDY